MTDKVEHFEQLPYQSEDFEKLKYETVDDVNHITVIWNSQKYASYTLKTSERVKQIFDLFQKMSHFKGGTVLEVGPGEGRLADMILNHYSVESYTVLDLKKNFKDSEPLLKGKVRYVESKDYEQIWHKRYDLFVSTFCISETPNYYKDNLYAHVLPNCDNAFIVDGDTNSKRPGFFDFEGELEEVMKQNFAHVEKRDSGMHYCMAIAGGKK